MFSEYARVPWKPSPSVARTVKANVPDTDGVPLSTPALLRVTPAGSAPTVTAKVYGAVPPVAVSVWLYATENTPAGSVAGLIVIVGADSARV